MRKSESFSMSFKIIIIIKTTFKLISFFSIRMILYLLLSLRSRLLMQLIRENSCANWRMQEPRSFELKFTFSCWHIRLGFDLRLAKITLNIGFSLTSYQSEESEISYWIVDPLSRQLLNSNWTSDRKLAMNFPSGSFADLENVWLWFRNSFFSFKSHPPLLKLTKSW